jgi:hypothetical protein
VGLRARALSVLELQRQARPVAATREELLDHAGAADGGQESERAPGCHSKRHGKAALERSSDLCRKSRRQTDQAELAEIRAKPGDVRLCHSAEREGLRGSITIAFEGRKVSKTFSRKIR